MGSGSTVMAELALGDVAPRDYDAVVFPGAGVWDYLNPPRDDAAIAVRAIIDTLQADSKPVAAIGRGQMALVMFGYLDNKQAAVNFEVRKEFAMKPVQWRGDLRVVESGGIITAAGAGDADAMLRLLEKKLAK